MPDPSHTPNTELTISGNGGDPRRIASRYCAFCGQEALAAAPERFGEVFCSEGHAEEFAQGVRSARVAAAATAVVPAAVSTPEPQTQTAGPTKRSDWKMAVKMAACCAVPILGLLVLAGGGGALLGAAGAVAPLLLALACPLGMIFMMRGMAKMGQSDKGKGDRDTK